MITILPAELYRIVYFIVLTALTLTYYRQLANATQRGVMMAPKPYTLMVTFAVAFIIVVGLRPISSAFGDTVNNARTYFMMQDGLQDAPTPGDGEYVFNLLMWNCAKVMPVQWFFFIIEIGYVLPLVLACWRMDRRNAPILLLFTMSAFSFFSFGTNGLRNGLACSLVFLALTYIRGNVLDKWVCGGLCFLAFNIHRSSLLPIAAMVLTWFYRKPRTMYYFWVASIFVSLVAGGAVSNFFASLGFDDRISSYFVMDDEDAQQFSRTGFRWDFLLYSFMPLWIAWYAIFKRRMCDMTYLILFGMYVYSNAFWIMVIRSSFSNRFAYLSWFLYPVVLAYPMLRFPLWKQHHGRKTALVLLAHFAFTFLMWLIGK